MAIVPVDGEAKAALFLENLVAHRDLRHMKLEWLDAKWCSEKRCFMLGCKQCEYAVQQGTVTLPHRYRDPLKSQCFAHFNVYRDHVRGVGAHPNCKMHKEVVGTPVQTALALKIQDQNDVLQRHTFLCVRHLLRLHPWSTFAEAVEDASCVGDGPDGVVAGKYNSRIFYDENLEQANKIVKKSF